MCGIDERKAADYLGSTPIVLCRSQRTCFPIPLVLGEGFSSGPLQSLQPAVKLHVKCGHQAHINESDDKQHQEGNCRIVLVADCVIDDKHEIQPQHDLDDGHDAGTSQILL